MPAAHHGRLARLDRIRGRWSALCGEMSLIKNRLSKMARGNPRAVELFFHLPGGEYRLPGANHLLFLSYSYC